MGGGAGADHGLLTGLGDDDHPQYETSAEAQAKVDAHVNDAGDAHDASAVSVVPFGTIAATDVQAALEEVVSEGAGHPNLAAHDTLGLATQAELDAHGAAGDPHSGYRLESADHSHASTGAQGGTIDHGVITGLGDDDHPQYRLEADDHSHASAGAQAGKIDHGAALLGLTDDDHTQYLKEEASGGTAAEVPDHTHASGAEAGTVAHSALTGITSGDHHAQAHGAGDHTDITRSLYVNNDGWFLDGATSVSVGTAPDLIRGASCADAATNGVSFNLLIPQDFASGLSITPIWSPGSTDAGANAVRWSVDHLVLAAGGDVDSAGTTSAWTGAAAARTITIMVVDTSQSLAGGAAGNVLRVNLRRLGSDGADTYVGAVILIGIRIDYTANQ